MAVVSVNLFCAPAGVPHVNATTENKSPKHLLPMRLDCLELTLSTIDTLAAPLPADSQVLDIRRLAKIKLQVVSNAPLTRA